MSSVVFTTKEVSSYDDLPEERYHFPRTYLRAAESAVGGFALYYEPRRTTADPSSRGGRQAYFAVAHVDRISEDPRIAGHFYAYVSNYLEFVRPVPFRIEGWTPERRLSKDDGSTNKGLAGRAVREIADDDLAEIVSRGLARASAPGQLRGADELVVPRRMSVTEVTRALRDRAFREVVQRVYDSTCAVTGLRIVNGGGAAEIEAAHIRAVAQGGPDSPRNGLALSRTVHWMFDRFVFTIEDDLTLRLPRAATHSDTGGLVRHGARLIVPHEPSERPHPAFLRWHREQFTRKHGNR